MEKKQKLVLTYKEYCEEFPPWNKVTFKKKVEEEGFPAIKDGKSWVMSRREVELWWKRKGLKVS